MCEVRGCFGLEFDFFDLLGLHVSALRCCLGEVMGDALRLSKLVVSAYSSGLSLDLLELLTRGLDAQAFAMVVGNVSALPKKRKSNEVP